MSNKDQSGHDIKTCPSCIECESLQGLVKHYELKEIKDLKQALEYVNEDKLIKLKAHDPFLFEFILEKINKVANQHHSGVRE